MTDLLARAVRRSPVGLDEWGEPFGQDHGQSLFLMKQA
jgi:hypothetical protein